MSQTARLGGEPRETLERLQRCLAGDAAAIAWFQETFGELIYGYPVRVYRTAVDEAGDFYVFAFDNGRIFRRLRTFEGRAPLRAYLLGFVLDDLVLEWKRGRHEVETISLEDIGEVAQPDSALALSDDDGAEDGMRFGDLLAGLEPSKAVVLKLLYIEDCEMTAPDLDLLARNSDRSLAEVIQGIDNLRAVVRERESDLKRDEDALDAVQAWIQLYERRVQRISAELADTGPKLAQAQSLTAELQECQRKLHKRRQQRDKLLFRARRKKTTAPYKEVAAILNTTVGNIGSQIARLRRELADALGDNARRWLGGDNDD